jgi:hypothetical protein
VFALVYSRDEEAEERVGQDAFNGRIGEICMYNQQGDEREYHPISQSIETTVGIQRPDYTIAVGVEEVTVLLQDLFRDSISTVLTSIATDLGRTVWFLCASAYFGEPSLLSSEMALFAEAVP